MKRTIHTTLGLLALLALPLLDSCDKNDTPVYDATHTALNLWFGTAQGSVYDHATYNFSHTMGEGSVTFYARVMGTTAPYDRTFTLQAIGGDTAALAGAYETELYTLAAGESSTTGRIRFNSAKLNGSLFASESQEGSITFGMVPNERFEEGAAEMRTLTVKLLNYLAKPEDWESAEYPMRALSLFFGNYSKVKYQFIIDVTGYVDFHVSYNQSAKYDEETNTLSNGYANYLRQLLAAALEEYNATHDTPLTDETGELVTF